MLGRIILQSVVLFLPTQLSIHFWPQFSFINGIRIDYLAPALYFVDILVVFLLIHFFVWQKGFMLLQKHSSLILVILLIAGSNIVFSGIPLLSLYRWIRIAEGLMLYLYAKNSKNFLNAIAYPLLFSLFFSLALSVLQIINEGSLNGILYFVGERAFRQSTPGIALANIFGNEYLRPYATFPHPNVLAGYSLVSFFLFGKRSDKWSRLGMVVSMILILLSFSQNAWVALIGTPIVLFCLRFLKLNILKFLVPVVVLSLLLTLAPNFPESSQEISQRILLNQEAGRIIATAPITGVGLGAFIPNLEGSFFQPVHNLFLLITAEAGIVGLLVMVYFIYRNTNKHNLAPIVAILMLSLWDHYFMTINQTSLLFFMILGYNGDNDENIL